VLLIPLFSPFFSFDLIQLRAPVLLICLLFFPRYHGDVVVPFGRGPSPSFFPPSRVSSLPFFCPNSLYPSRSRSFFFSAHLVKYFFFFFPLPSPFVVFIWRKSEFPSFFFVHFTLRKNRESSFWIGQWAHALLPLFQPILHPSLQCSGAAPMVAVPFFYPIATRGTGAPSRNPFGREEPSFPEPRIFFLFFFFVIGMTSSFSLYPGRRLRFGIPLSSFFL